MLHAIHKYSWTLSRAVAARSATYTRSSQLGHYKTSWPPIWDMTRLSDMGWLEPFVTLRDFCPRHEQTFLAKMENFSSRGIVSWFSLPPCCLECYFFSGKRASIHHGWLTIFKNQLSGSLFIALKNTR